MSTPATSSAFDAAGQARSDRSPQPDTGEVRLSAAQAHRIAAVLGLVEDFFTHHSGPGVRSALGRFAAGQGWRGPRAAAGLIDEVFFAAAPLHQAITTAHLRPATTGADL